MAKVMVVDDAFSELKLMEGILKSAGLEVVCFPDGDRIEVYRALVADPKEHRLRRAAAGPKARPR